MSEIICKWFGSSWRFFSTSGVFRPGWAKVQSYGAAGKCGSLYKESCQINCISCIPKLTYFAILPLVWLQVHSTANVKYFVFGLSSSRWSRAPSHKPDFTDIKFCLTFMVIALSGKMDGTTRKKCTSLLFLGCSFHSLRWFSVLGS